MLRTIFFLSILVPGLLVAFKSRYAALLLYFWFTFFRPEDFIYIDVSAFRLSLTIGALVVIPALLSGKMPNVTHPLSIGMILFLMAAGIAGLDASNQVVAQWWLEYTFKLFLIALLAITLIDTRERFLMAVSVIGLSFGFHAAKAGLASLLVGGVRFGSGLGGSFQDNNAYAIGMAMTGPLLVCVAQNTTSRILRWGCVVAVPLIAVGVVGTYSRSGFLALVAAALTLVSFQPRRAGLLLIVTLMSIPLGLFMTRQEGYLSRLQTITTYEEVEEVSAVSRPHFWKVAVAMAQAQPFGVGLFNYQANYNRYDSLGGEYGTGRAVHSSHFQVLAETGFFGAALWAGMFGYGFLVAFKVRRRGFRSEDPVERATLVTGANALMASMLAFVVGGAFISMALNELTWITFALIASLDRISRGLGAEAPAVAPSYAVFNSGLLPARAVRQVTAR
jgi:probable O-glycosylation ligase (exosortase A-associated)